MRDDATTAGRRVVVGVDGSSEANAALEEAVREAASRHAELDVVHVWSPPYTAGPMGAMALPTDLASCEAAARKVLDQSVARVMSRIDDKPPRVEPILVNNHSVARMLVNTAKGADLLVVGSRGRGGFTGLLLGSVSQQCVHHATCPVIVVPPPAA